MHTRIPQGLAEERKETSSSINVFIEYLLFVKPSPTQFNIYNQPSKAGVPIIPII